MLTDDEARDAIRDFQAAIDRLVIDVAIALKPWAESTQHALTAAFTPFFERLRDDYPEAFDEDGVLRQMSTASMRRASAWHWWKRWGVVVTPATPGAWSKFAVSA